MINRLYNKKIFMKIKRVKDLLIKIYLDLKLIVNILILLELI